MATKKKTTEVKAPAHPYKEELSWVLIGPRITEKAAYATDSAVYTFNVAIGANKQQVKKAIERNYKVIPQKITMIRMKPQRTFIRGRVGTQKAYKKAMVFLKKGETIEFA